MADENNLSTLAKRLRPLLNSSTSPAYVIQEETYGLRVRYNNGAGSITTRFQVDADGDLFIGEDISTAGKTFLSIFVNAQTYNSEAVSAGDVLIGDNSASKANIFWDKSEGRLKFRSGPTSKSYIDTDGSFLVIAPTGGVYDRTAAVTWNDGSADIATLGAYSYTAGASIGCELKTNSVTGKSSITYVLAKAPSDKTASVILVGDSGAGTYLTKIVMNASSTGRSVAVTGSTFEIGSDSAACDFWYSGKMVSWRSTGLTYDTWPLHPLTTPLTSTSWDGDSYSTTAKTLIDLSTVFGAPAGIKAVLIYFTIRDAGSSAGDYYLVLGPTNTAGKGMVATCPRSGNDHPYRGCMVVPCDSNGDIYYEIAASGSLTFDVWLEIWGYWI